MDKSNMITKLLILFMLVFFSNITLAGNTLSDIKNKLHFASNNFEQSVDHDSVVNSLYKQIRPRAKITKKNLGSEEIDKKVRTYVIEKYAPALIENYSHLYSKLKEEKKDFSSCNTPESIDSGKDVLISLCVEQSNNSIQVLYMTNGYGRGWSKSVVFIFKMTGNTLLLSAIELQLKEGVKTHVEGI